MRRMALRSRTKLREELDIAPGFISKPAAAPIMMIPAHAFGRKEPQQNIE
jgi:hypothetical protein